ncbi:MAG: hypothetical protein JXA66_02505 [Oligoflexia bacterium]|nr:hypothetical protein [Oligoflexia bacterium]
MRKVVLAALFAVLSAPLFASELTLDAKVGYARTQGGANGFDVGAGVYYSLMQTDGFLQDLAVGGAFDFDMTKFGGTWGKGLFIGPEVKLSMPFSYFKLGMGYQGVDEHQFGLKIRVGGLYPIGEGMQAGLDFTFGYTLNAPRFWMITVGPAFSMDL